MNKLSILICSLLSATCTIIHAAAPKEVIQQVEVLDYTATHSKKPIDNTVDPDELDEEDLVDDLITISSRAEDNHILLNVILSNQRPPTKQQVAAQAQDKKEQPIKENHDDEKEGNEDESSLPISYSPGQPANDIILQTNQKVVYKRYILDATGLLNKKVHKTAQKNYGYHVIQTQASHIIPALCQWLKVSKEKYIVGLSISGAICLQCKYLLNVVIGYTKEVKTDAKGCQAASFTWPMPKLAMQFTNKYILQSGKPLQITQTILDKMVGISETGTRQLQQELKTIKKQLKEQAKQEPTLDPNAALALFQKNVKERSIPRNQGDNNWYLDNIEKQLKGLAKALPQMDKAAHKKEAKILAAILASLPKFVGYSMGLQYESVQYRLIELKEMVGVEAKKVIDYNTMTYWLLIRWSGC